MFAKVFTLEEIQTIYPFNHVEEDNLGFIIQAASLYQSLTPLIIPTILPVIDGHQQPFDYTAAWDDCILESLLSDLKITAPKSIFASTCRFGHYLDSYYNTGTEKIACFQIATDPLTATHLQIAALCERQLTVNPNDPLSQLARFYADGYASYHNAAGRLEQILCDISIANCIMYYPDADEIIGNWIIPTSAQTHNTQSKCAELLKDATTALKQYQPQPSNAKIITFPSP